MDTQRVFVNGIAGKEKINNHDEKIASEDDKTTSPLLAKSNEIKYIDSVNESKDVEKTRNDLNTINSMKTQGNGFNDNRLSVEYSKDDPNDDDAKSTNERVKFLGVGDADSICSSNHLSQEQEPQIPDGGWGWVVVAASFLIATVADGLAFSYGLLQIKFVDFFEASEAKTSLIGSLFISVPLIAGPIMSALVDRYGCKKMTMVGGIFSTVGFVAASYSNSVEALYITYGLIAGLGMGLLYVTAVVSIAYWFEKRRNLAVGLGACGVGFGTFIYSPLTSYLLDEYGWRGALLLLAGTVLNVCICGAVMRDPEWLILEQKKQRRLNKAKRANSSTSISARSARSARSGGGESLYPGAEELKTLMQSGEAPEHILTALVAAIAEAENVEATTKMNADLSSQQKVSSVINLPTFLRQSEKVTPEVLDQLTSNDRLYNIILQNYPSLLALRSTSETKLSMENPTKEKLSKKKKKDFDKKLKMVKQNLLQPVPENNIVTSPKVERNDWLMKQFQTDRHYLRDIRVHRNSIMHRGAMMNIAKYRLKASSCPDIYKNSMWSMEEDQEERTWSKKVIHAINKTFDFNMFTEFHFLMMNLSTLVLFIWFIVPYFYISTFMEDNGYTETEGSLMLSVFGVATIIGIVGLGWIGDLPWVNITKTYAMCLIACGISIVLFPILIRVMDAKESHSFYILAINALFFGLTFSSSYSYTPSILVELIALERFTMAYGLVLLSQGLGHLIGPPMAGALKDKTGYWDAAFYIAGIWVVVSGLLVAVIPYTKNFRIYGNAPLAKDVAVDPEPGVKIIIAH